MDFNEEKDKNKVEGIPEDDGHKLSQSEIDNLVAALLNGAGQEGK